MNQEKYVFELVNRIEGVRDYTKEEVDLPALGLARVGQQIKSLAVSPNARAASFIKSQEGETFEEEFEAKSFGKHVAFTPQVALTAVLTALRDAGCKLDVNTGGPKFDPESNLVLSSNYRLRLSKELILTLNLREEGNNRGGIVPLDSTVCKFKFGAIIDPKKTTLEKIEKKLNEQKILSDLKKVLSPDIIYTKTIQADPNAISPNKTLTLNIPDGIDIDDVFTVGQLVDTIDLSGSNLKSMVPLKVWSEDGVKKLKLGVTEDDKAVKERAIVRHSQLKVAAFGAVDDFLADAEESPQSLMKLLNTPLSAPVLTNGNSSPVPRNFTMQMIRAEVLSLVPEFEKHYIRANERGFLGDEPSIEEIVSFAGDKLKIRSTVKRGVSKNGEDWSDVIIEVATL